MTKLTYRQKYDRTNLRISIRLRRTEVKFIDSQRTEGQSRADWIQKLVRKEIHRIKKAGLDQEKLLVLIDAKYEKRDAAMEDIFNT